MRRFAGYLRKLWKSLGYRLRHQEMYDVGHGDWCDCEECEFQRWADMAW